MKQFKETIYAYRQSEENWDIQDKAEELGFGKEEVRNLKWLGGEIKFEVLISEDGSTEALKINGVDVSEMGIFV